VKKSKTSPGNPWERTQVQCLLRHKQSRRYYGRFKVNGKQKWVALDTDVFSVAKLRLGDEADKFRKIRGTVADVTAGKATMRQFFDIYRQRSQSNQDLRPSTVTSRLVAVKRVIKTWPGLEDLEPGQVTASAVQAWVARLKHVGTRYTPPGTKTVRKGNSPSSINLAIDALRWVLDIALERGQIHTNPARVKPTNGRLKKKVVQKKLVLPSRTEVGKLLAAMEAVPGWGQEGADLCRFLKMSGARIGEVPLVTWKKIDWEGRRIHLPGFKTETSDRFIPLFAPLETFLRELMERRKKTAKIRSDKRTFLEPNEPIIRIRECQKTIDAGCTASGVQRITHHDFRHLFATAVIESGVDIPTLSRWLGHNDGGVLAMKTYGHLRTEHSQLSAQKVMF
jgi:integrase